jgi:hypothetical protein
VKDHDGSYGTGFQESNALLAVQNDDIEEAQRVLADMLPGELIALADAAEMLADLARTRARTGLRPAWATS